MKRFWTKVDKSGECWMWTAGKSLSGYGHFWVKGRHERTNRVSWTIHHGPIPDGMLVLHRCDEPSCVNPDHLFLGTHADNAKDRKSKGRNGDMRGEKSSGAKLTDRDVLKIRELLQLGGLTQTRISEMFGVGPCVISLIKVRKIWSHI